jgi:hypothetical protein
MKKFRLMAGGGRLAAGAVLTGLLSLGVSVPASAQTLTWSVVPSPSAGVGNASLAGVSCASATACMAVGSFFNSSSVSRNLADSWDGTSWTGVPTPNPGPAGRWQFLEDVSCPAATACTAVGYSWTPGGPDIPLVESWDGTSWTVVHAPNPATSGGNTLMGVSCPSATACTAVGYSYISGGFYRTFIESWDGTSWTVVPSPNPVPGGDYLDGVSCASATACMAVGYATKNSTAPGLSRALIESWDGTSWTIVDSPNRDAADFLYRVSCASAAACIAVGYSTNSSGTYRTLTESWDGTSWTIVPSPNRGPEENYLEDVSCISATACTASGASFRSGTDSTTLIESWDGTSWTIVSSPGRGTSSGLGSISCISATACMAAGFSINSNGVYRTLTESGTASS